jgi:pyruvate dehydrogenase E1 component alpha subunit/2-oxoisovalerate dehydrogenase E1 component alpha subunit
VSVARTPGTPPDFPVPPAAAGDGDGTPAGGAVVPAPPPPRKLGKGRARSGLGPKDSLEDIEIWTDEAWALATGLVEVLDEQGHADPALVPALTRAELVDIFRGMITSRLLDGRLLPLQRQGRIGFYIGASGQEAGIIGGAHALGPDDYLVPGLRETSAALYRGLPLRTHLAQVFGNGNDLCHGRQLPCHSGSRASRHVIMSSCVSTQIPHATGIAWAAKISRDPVVALCYLGDGGTSQEDFHTGLNFAGAFRLPVVFVCQNNQWAISTPLNLQTASETIAVKGLAYGIPSIRVDGNDVLAMYATAKQAVDRARGGGGPTFIEALTYRIGPHSSSDDPSRYRDEAEAAAWKPKDPLVRFGRWLASTGALPEVDQGTLHEEIDRGIREAIALEEAAAPPLTATLIQDVYAAPNWILEEQLADLERVRGKSAKP